MTKNNLERKADYFKKNKLAMAAVMTTDDGDMFDVTIHVAADINYDEKLPGFNVENDDEQNIVEFHKVLPYLESCIWTFYNRKEHAIETVVIPNPYFTDVFLLTDAVDNLITYIDGVIASVEKQGKKLGDYISFTLDKIGVVCG